MADEKASRQKQSGAMSGVYLQQMKRTTANVEKEMNRLLKRALEDMHEDAASFGLTNLDN